MQPTQPLTPLLLPMLWFVKSARPGRAAMLPGSVSVAIAGNGQRRGASPASQSGSQHAAAPDRLFAERPNGSTPTHPRRTSCGTSPV